MNKQTNQPAEKKKNPLSAIIIVLVVLAVLGAAAMIGMRSGIIQAEYDLRCPLLPPPFFPKTQTRTESPVLIREFPPRLFREISRAVIRMY